MPEMSEIPLGITADELLKLPGRSKRDWIRKARRLGVERKGPPPWLIVAWYYPDYTVELRRREKDGITAYRVVKVDLSVKARRRARRRSATGAANA